MTPKPLAAFREFLVRLPKGFAGPVPPALGREVAGILLADTRRRFSTGTAPDGKRWKAIRRRVNGGDKPLLDTGVLRASVQARPTATGAVVFSTLPYAALHQFGGTVRAKRAKYLALPLTREAKRAGSPRRFKVPLKFRPFRRRGTGGVLYSGAGAAKADQYLLVREVEIPARPFLGASERAAADIADAAARWVERQLPKE